MQKTKFAKIALVVLILAIIGLFYLLGGPEYLNLNTIKQQQLALQSGFESEPLFFVLSFATVYILVTALSLPVATLLTLLAGSIFGFVYGLIIVSFTSTIGATLAFLTARFVLRDQLQQRYSEQLKKINAGFAKEGGSYIFALRLVPVFPFFVINLVMGLLPVKTRIFYLFSQIGMLPGTAVFVFAGTELRKINSVADIASPGLLVAFALIGLFPIMTKKVLALFKE